MTASQRFNVGYLFLYGTLWERPSRDDERFYSGPDRTIDHRIPAFKSGMTDWHARCVSLPTIAKQTEVWSGDIQTSQIDFQLADTDGGASATLYASSTSPLGKPVAVYMKMSDNPTYWSAIFTGNIIRASKRKGLITLTVEDTARNLLNSQFVGDYQCLATMIDSSLYGTIKDVIGTNIYVDDKYEESYITVSHGADTDWVTSILSLGVPALIGGIGGIGMAALGLAGGALGLLGAKNTSKWEERYIKVRDYNVIPDGVVAGGQNFKFTRGSVPAFANGTAGALYYVPTIKSKGGHFENGVKGTIELDDILHNARKGDYIYVEQPLMYWGSPDDIIMNMLTGSNVTVRYSYPQDFSADWISQTAPLKHIECWADVSNFDLGGVSEAIGKLAEEFGFSFYVDEDNKYAVRAVRDISIISTSIVGTMSENYNILNDGITSTEDLLDNFTDLEFKYKDAFYGKQYEQSYIATLGGATYFGGVKRVKTIQSAWIHDTITGQYIAKRMARRYATATKKIECDVSLYSGPFRLGEIVRANGWAVGTNKMCEIISYSKDLGRSICSVVGEDAESIYSGRSYFYLQSGAGSITATSRAGFGTVISNAVFGYTYAYNYTTIGMSDSEITVEIGDAGIGSLMTLPGTCVRMGVINEEVMKVISVDKITRLSDGTNIFSIKVDRGYGDTMVGSYVAGYSILKTSEPTATCFNIGTIYGQTFRWF